MNIVGFIKNLEEKFREFIFPNYQKDEKEILLEEIIEFLLSAYDDTECITAPISGTYYISNEKQGLWMKVWDEGLILANHMFSYNYKGDYKFMKILISKIHEFMERDRAQFEQTVFMNEVELLKQVKEKMKV